MGMPATDEPVTPVTIPVPATPEIVPEPAITAPQPESATAPVATN